MDCGFDPVEIQHAKTGVHTYAEYRIFGGLSLVLCNHCDVDFCSYDPTFFGLPRSHRLDIGRWEFVRVVRPLITKDKCCIGCGYRLPFLKFVTQARQLHAEKQSMP